MYVYNTASSAFLLLLEGCLLKFDKNRQKELNELQ